MSWSSLFAFSNPNGDVGKQISGVSNVAISNTLSVTGAIAYTKIATFNSLPIGVYSISTQSTLTMAANTDTRNINIGLSQTNGTPVALFPETSNAIIISALSSYNVILNSNFIISVTNANPYYIYMEYNIVSGSATFASITTAIATKLA